MDFNFASPCSEYPNKKEENEDKLEEEKEKVKSENHFFSYYTHPRRHQILTY